MKLKLRILNFGLLFFIQSSFLNAQVIDQFDDDNFTSNPSWIGEDSLWQISNKILSSNCLTTNKTFQLTTANNQLQNTQWEWYQKLNFATSSTNYVDVYLNANNSNLLSPNLNGYFLRIGNTNDEISFYKNINGIETIIIDGPNGQVPTNSEYKFKVTCKSNTWKIYVQDIQNNATNYSLIDSVFDNSLTTSNFFGFKVKQSTASFFQKHFFDNILIQNIVLDTIPPFINNHELKTKNEILFYLNEPILNNFTKNNFNISSLGIPDSVYLENTTIIHCLYSTKQFQDGNIQLNYFGLKDIEGNNCNQILYNFTIKYPKPYSVLINEIYSDYNPSVQLPAYKYIELKNNSSSNINLKNWYITEGNNFYTIPNLDLPKDSYLIIVNSYSAFLAYSSFGKTILISSFPTLNSTGSHLKLFSPDSILIHQFQYDNTSYRNEIKAEGGWSLELIDPTKACDYKYNISSSNDLKGGTPGQPNAQNISQYQNINNLQIDFIEIINSNKIKIYFNQDILFLPAFTTIINQENYIGFLDKNDLSIMYVDGLNLANKTIYTLLLNDVTNCSNSSRILKFDFGIPQSQIDSGEIIINEILSNAYDNSYDFIEIYNPSSNIFLASDILLNKKNTNNTFKETKTIINKQYILPQKHYLISSNTLTDLQLYYNIKNPNQIITLPFKYTINNDEDFICLTDNTGQIIDEVNFSSKWHFDLINDTKGFSLERISYLQSSKDSNNWQSCATSSGKATPTYENSNAINPNSSNSISIHPTLLTPNQDGEDDILLISYQAIQPQTLANVYLYNITGQLISTLIHNETLSNQGFFKWDAILENGTLCPVGHYWIVVETYLRGENKRIQKFSLNIAY